MEQLLYWRSLNFLGQSSLASRGVYAHAIGSLYDTIAVVAIAATASAQTVVKRIRLGNVVEGATYITSGPLANNFVFLSGWNVMAVPNGVENEIVPRFFRAMRDVPLVAG